MAATEYIEGTIYYVAEQLSIFLQKNGYPGVYAIAISGNPNPSETYLESYRDMLRVDQQKFQSMKTTPIHLNLNGRPATILVIGETIGISFAEHSSGLKVMLHVDIESSSYDVY